MTPKHQEAIDLKQLQLYPAAGWNGRNEERILPGGSNVATMWANGLGSTQTTPSAGAQAVPAPIVDRDTEFSTLFAWLQLTNQEMERPYDC
jgi:hypothetical protein